MDFTALDNVFVYLSLQRLGYQRNCNPPLWVIGRNLQVKVSDGHAVQVPEDESPCCILDGFFKVPHVPVEGIFFVNLETTCKE